MFNFMKKGDEKEKRKKEKDGKKKRDRDGISSEETARFDEMRRSLKLRRKKEKLPSGITADYTGNLFADMNRDLEANRSGSLPGYTSRSDSSEASVNSLPQAPAKVLPPLPPRPPKRGILKGPRNNLQDMYDMQDINNPMVLVKNTLQNEVITYQNVDKPTTALFLSTKNEEPNLLSVASSAESLTDTTNSSFATPPLLSPTEHPPPPPVVPLDLPPPRHLTIYRTARGDFGFQLRRAIVTDKLTGTSRKEVLFAEPGTLGGHTSDTGLLPGDVLLQVNGQGVQDKSREEIIAMIKNSGPSVTVQVQPIGELSEITRRCRPSVVDEPDNVSAAVVGGTLKRSASLRFRSTKARSDDELAKEKEWLDTEKLWLVHRSGFSAARAVPNSTPTDSGKVKARLESSEEVLEVQEEDLERANPPKLDIVENLCELRYINESSILHTLRQRFGNNLIHTYAAGSLIVINPECPLSIYNEKVASLFLGCDTDDMPPHIYASAQAAYRAMVHTRRDQSIVLLGRSGSGKTHNFRHLLSYILMAAGSTNKAVTMDKLNALHLVLEAFGNAKTLQNANATRCTNMISIDFDQSRQVASGSLQMIMLEKSRVARRPSGESSFHVFYYLLAGAEGSLSKQLFLDAVATGDNAFVNPVTKNDERQKCQMDFSKLCLALANLGVSEKECFVFWSVLAAIYHLGYAGVVQVGTAKWQFLDPASASRAARLLGATSDELAAALWDAPMSPSRSGSASPKSKDVLPGADALDGFVTALYAELVNIINAIINRCLASNVNTTASLVILDAPGFQCPGGPGTFSDLCHNYVQERLHLLHHNTTLLAPLDRYTQERVDVKIEELYSEQVSPSQLVALLDKPPPGGVLKTSQTDLRDADRRGLLWLTEEETVYPNSSDDTLLQHILQQYGTKEFTQYIKRWSGTGQLCIQHLQGNAPVVYNVRGWLRACREPRTCRTALALLQESSREDISELFVVGKGGGGMFSPEGASQSLRRVSSIRRTCSAAVKRKSLGLQVKHTTDSVIETLRRTHVRFVFCLSPQQWSGLGDGVPSSTASALVNIPLLRSQVRAVEILPAVRLFKQGYPDHVPHSEFVRRFRLLAGGDATPIVPVPTSPAKSEPPKVMVSNPNGVTTADEGRLVAEILFRADVDEVAYRIGLSEVFFRAGILSQLETQRDEKLSGVIVSLQSHCRGFIARKKLAKLRIQDTAVRCIQRNVRKLMHVREWPWWKLYVRIAPLLKVRSNEEELAARMREIETIRARLDKLEAENASLRLEKDKLESKTCLYNMEKSFGILDQINKALWKRKPKEEAVKVNDVVIDDARLDGGENSSEYWTQLSRRKKEPMGNQESEPSGVLTNGIVPVEQINITPDHVVPLEEEQKLTNTDETIPAKEPKKKKTGSRKTSVDVQSSVQVPSPSRRMSEIPKSNRSSGATSPEYGSRRDSGTLSPLSFNSIQDKILALSKDSSTVDVPKKKPKVKKLDEAVFAAVKEPVKEKPKEVVKIAPKIDSLLQSKISKFGEPSKGAKIPKKPQVKAYAGGLSFREAKEPSPMTPTRARKLKPKAPQPPNSDLPSVPSTPSSERKSKKLKEKAPLPPGCVKDELASLSSQVANLVEMSEVFSKELQDFSVKNSEVISKSRVTALPEPNVPQVANNSTPPEPETATSRKPEASAVPKTEQKMPEIPTGQIIPENSEKPEPKSDLPHTTTSCLPELVKISNESKPEILPDPVPQSNASKLPGTTFTEQLLPAATGAKFSAAPEGTIPVPDTPSDQSAAPLPKITAEKTSNKSKPTKLVPEPELILSAKPGKIKKPTKESTRPSPNAKKSALPENIVPNPSCDVPGQELSPSIESKSVTVCNNGEPEPDIKPEKLIQPTNLPETTTPAIPENTKKVIPEPIVVTTLNKQSALAALGKTEKDSTVSTEPVPEGPKTVPENNLAVVPFREKLPEILIAPSPVVADYLNFHANGEEFEDCETPKASRKLLNLYDEWSLVREDLKRSGGSSGSDSFHTPSPRPVMYTSRGEVIGMPVREESPEWTPSPDRELFTPETSPLSDFSDASYDHYVASVDFSVRSVSLPRRVYPQAPRPMSYHEDWKEESPVVLNAGLSFDLCSRRTPVRQHLRPLPAFVEPNTASNSLSCKIAEFLSRTDHIMEEWKRLGRSDPNEIHSLVELPTHRVNGTLRSKSAANIMIKGFQYFSRSSSRASWRSPSISKYSEASDRTLADLEELNELSADLSEERLSGAQMSERLDAETSERIRLEQELSQVNSKKSQLEQVAERMELELHYAKAYDNGISDAEDFVEGRDDGDVYKRKCARLKRENDMLRQQLRQQHEDDLEQLVGLKKQLEKRLADANEEIDEQRQVAAEWKRKSQKLQAELNDFRIIVEEQNSRNNLLEKKQRKFDAEIQMLQDELRGEKNARDRFSRDRDVAMSNKCSVEQTLASVRMELEQKEEEVKRLTQELEDMTLGGASEQDVNQLRKAKHDLDKKLKEQEDELDDLAGQVSLLEGTKLKLEMSIENMRKEYRKEIAQKEEELEEARSVSNKKLKGMEAVLEQEYEERSALLRVKHELERRLKEFEEMDRSNRAADEDALIRLRKDLRKTKALLRDAQAMLERAKEDGPGKVALRALKNQLDDAELARDSAVKAKQKLTAELNELGGQLEDANRLKNEAESRSQAAMRQVNTLKGQLEENEEELAEMMKKYHQHLASEEARNQEAASTLADVEAERNSLREQLAEATAKLEAMAVVDTTPDMNQRRLEVTIHDLKSRIELDATMRKRMEVHTSRLKEKMERLNEECTTLRAREEAAAEQVRKLQVSMREMKEELAIHAAREQESIAKRKDLEKKLAAAESAESAARNEAKLCMQRVQDLQSALIAEIDSESEDISDGESL